MKNKIFRLPLLAVVIFSILFSCSKNDDDNDSSSSKNADIIPKNETWIIFNGNADWSGGIYALKESTSSAIKLSGSFYQLSRSLGGRVVDNKLYKLNGSTPTEIGITKFSIDASQNITNAGFLATPSNTYETNCLIVSDTEGYYWDLSRGGLKIQTFNPSTMQRTGELDFTSLSKGSSYEASGQYILAKRDNKLYVDIQHGKKEEPGDWQVTPNETKVFIAVYNLSTNAIEGVTEYPDATNLGLFSDHPLWSIDNVTKDLYVVAVGNVKTQTPPSKILRIKNGENKFDPNFELKRSDYDQYPSDFNRIFAYNNKIYTTISSRPASYYAGKHGVDYRSDIWYWNEIDVNTKKATQLDIPVDNFYSYQNPFYHNGEIYFLSNNVINKFSGVTQYNPETGKTKETFHLKESGRIMGFAIITE